MHFLSSPSGRLPAESDRSPWRSPLGPCGTETKRSDGVIFTKCRISGSYAPFDRLGLVLLLPGCAVRRARLAQARIGNVNKRCNITARGNVRTWQQTARMLCGFLTRTKRASCHEPLCSARPRRPHALERLALQDGRSRTARSEGRRWCRGCGFAGSSLLALVRARLSPGGGERPAAESEHPPRVDNAPETPPLLPQPAPHNRTRRPRPLRHARWSAIIQAHSLSGLCAIVLLFSLRDSCHFLAEGRRMT